MIFSRHSRAANYTIRSPIWLKLELIPAFMVCLITFKNEEDPIKNEGARVATRLYVNFSDILGQVYNSIDNVGIWQKFDLIRAFMHVLIACKIKKI